MLPALLLRSLRRGELVNGSSRCCFMIASEATFDATDRTESVSQSNQSKRLNRGPAPTHKVRSAPHARRKAKPRTGGSTLDERKAMKRSSTQQWSAEGCMTTPFKRHSKQCQAQSAALTPAANSLTRRPNPRAPASWTKPKLGTRTERRVAQIALSAWVKPGLAAQWAIEADTKADEAYLRHHGALPLKLARSRLDVARAYN